MVGAATKVVRHINSSLGFANKTGTVIISARFVNWFDTRSFLRLENGSSKWVLVHLASSLSSYTTKVWLWLGQRNQTTHRAHCVAAKRNLVSAGSKNAKANAANRRRRLLCLVCSLASPTATAAAAAAGAGATLAKPQGHCCHLVGWQKCHSICLLLIRIV